MVVYLINVNPNYFDIFYFDNDEWLKYDMNCVEELWKPLYDKILNQYALCYESIKKEHTSKIDINRAKDNVFTIIDELDV